MAQFKLLTLLGIRPDYIRMFKVIKLLDAYGAGLEHILVHSGQHYDPELFGNFLKEFSIRTPDVDLGIGLSLKERGGGTWVEQCSLLNERLAEFLQKTKPDAVMYLGDTNTVLSSIVPARMGIPVIHLEAGGRSFDWRMPEEKNRLTIDHLSDALYSYLDRYKDLLVAEGVAPARVTVIGNIIVDAVQEFMPQVEASNVLDRIGVAQKGYILFGLHREENVTDGEIFGNKVKDILRFAEERGMQVVWPLMPRASAALDRFDLRELAARPFVHLTQPLGFFDFLRLERDARLIVSDSGTVQEEALLVRTPCVVARRSTERPETIKAGATILEGFEGLGVLYAKMAEAWDMPTDWDTGVLNPLSGSPSERVYADLIDKIQHDYFKTSRTFEAMRQDSRVTDAYHAGS